MRYYRPSSIQESQALLRQHAPDDTKVLAGGTDIVPHAGHTARLPGHLVDIKHLKELQGITVTATELQIGALATIEEIRRHPLVQQEFSGLHQAASQFAGLQIRNRATLGGNICNASPAGDTLPVLYAFEARLEIITAEAKRETSIGDFIIGPGTVALESDELLSRVILPRRGHGSTFFKLGLRNSMAISVVNLAATWKLKPQGFDHLKLMAGAVAPTIVSLDDYARAVIEAEDPSGLDTSLIEKSIAPIDDVRATARYRTLALKNIVQATVLDIYNKNR